MRFGKSNPRRVTLLLGLLAAASALFWRTTASSNSSGIPQNIASTSSKNSENWPLSYVAGDRKTNPYFTTASKDADYIANQYDDVEPDAPINGFIERAAQDGYQLTPWPEGFRVASTQKDYTKINVYADPTYWAQGYYVVQRIAVVARGGKFSVFGLQCTNQLVPAELFDSENPRALLDLESSNFTSLYLTGDIKNEFIDIQDGKFSALTRYYNVYYADKYAYRETPTVKTINLSTGEETWDFYQSPENWERSPGDNRRVYRLSEVRNR